MNGLRINAHAFKMIYFEDRLYEVIHSKIDTGTHLCSKVTRIKRWDVINYT